MFVEVESVSFSYPGAGRPALSQVCFRLSRGECLGIVGGPGAGKSTLAALLAGILVPASGHLAAGDASGGASPGGIASRRRLVSRVGYVPQRPEHQLFARTVAEDVAAGLGKMAPPRRDEMVQEALASVGLPGQRFGHRSIFALSGAEARKVAMAGVLVLDHPVIVFDEPTAGLDPASRGDITELMRRLKGRGKTLLIISHRLEDLLPLADRLLVLDDGVQLFFGGLEDAARSPERLRGAVAWPPLNELMMRIQETFPGLPILVRDAAAAGAAIARRLADRS